MNNYSYQPIVTEKYASSTGHSHTYINPDRLENFKSAIESHVSALTYELQSMKNHANWIQPRLNDFHRFMVWMEQAHPDIIEAYKKSTEVAEKLDRANHGEEVMMEASA